jgi:hypothetical protein
MSMIHPRRGRRPRRTVAGSQLAALAIAAASGAAVPAAGLMAGAASAAPLCSGTEIVTCVFSSHGVSTAWPVPSGVRSLLVTADGASGAAALSTFVNGGGPGGRGGEFQAALDNIPSGTTLAIFPGNTGAGAVGGINAGGQGGVSSLDTHGNTGGGGGGATTVAVSPFSVSHLLVVAGGGGGGAAENNNPPPRPASGGGVGGGSSNPYGGDGGPGAHYTNNYGRGGRPTTGGSAGGGTTGGCTAQTSGSQLAGGNGQRGLTCPYAGGAGGSGYFGGGGGGTGGGGGGGSAFPARPTFVRGIVVTPEPDFRTHNGNGVVTITYVRGVHRTHLRLWATRYRGALTLFAQLTGDGQPLPAQLITFGTWRRTLCRVPTDSNGVASCYLTRQQTQVVDYYGGYFTASYAGAAFIPPTSAYGFAP